MNMTDTQHSNAIPGSGQHTGSTLMSPADTKYMSKMAIQAALAVSDAEEESPRNVTNEAEEAAYQFLVNVCRKRKYEELGTCKQLLRQMAKLAIVTGMSESAAEAFVIMMGISYYEGMRHGK